MKVSKKNIKYLIWLPLACILILVSCEKEVDLDITKKNPHYVVDGLITTRPGPYKVYVYRSAAFTQQLEGTYDPEQGATVIISDDLGNEHYLYEAGNGAYQTSFLFQGEAGRTYTIRVITETGIELESYPEMLHKSPPIDSMYYEFEEATQIYPEGHKVSIVTIDPPGEKNYYRWDWKGVYSFTTQFDGPGSTTCWRYEFDINYLTLKSDNLIDGNALHQPIAWIPFFSTTKYLVTVEQQSLTKSAYDFWALVDKQNNNVGSVFDSPPTRIKGNLYNVTKPEDPVLGYFGASDFSIGHTMLYREGIPPISLLRSYPRNVNCATLANSELFFGDNYPEGWE
jgi:hypothetical protein